MLKKIIQTQQKTTIKHETKIMNIIFKSKDRKIQNNQAQKKTKKLSI